MGEAFTIGQVAKQAGIRTSRIRYYESVGLLSAPPRMSGRRVYHADVFDTLRLIQFGQDAGFSIDEIRHVLDGFDRRTRASERWQKVAKRKLEDVATVIERAQRMRRVLESLLSCECIQLSGCVAACGPPQAPVRQVRARRAVTR